MPDFVDYIIHFDRHLAELVSAYGPWVYGLLFAAALDGFLMWRRLKQKLVAKFGEEKVGRGLAMYAVMRGFQIRRSRMPRPLVSRGQYPD